MMSSVENFLNRSRFASTTTTTTAHIYALYKMKISGANPRPGNQTSAARYRLIV